MTKPKKPYPEFPLFAHANGQWCKKIKGKHHFFGVHDDPDAALRTYLDSIDEIHAGRDPKRMQAVDALSESATIRDTMNHFLAAMDERMQAGEITARHFADYRVACKVVVKHFGTRATVASLRAVDFSDLRKSFPGTWGPTTVGSQIQRIRTAFKWAAEAEVISRIPNFGPEFKKPRKSVLRRTKQARQAKHGKLSFDATELQTFLKKANGWLKAAIMLGVNAGFGNADCGRLQAQHIDFEGGWYDLPREKSGIPRRFYIWPETRDAIREAMHHRAIPKDNDDDDLCFLTSHGKPIWWQSDKGDTRDNVGVAFLKLCRNLDADENVPGKKHARPGRGFYSLRRTFETIGGNSKDQIAVNFAMGHHDETMAAVYRQGIDDQRLVDVAEHVRQWLWTRPCGKCKKTQFSIDAEWKCASCGHEHSGGA